MGGSLGVHVCSAVLLLINLASTLAKYPPCYSRTLPCSRPVFYLILDSSDTLRIIDQMNLARHSISSTAPILIFDARFDADARIFTCATQAGFAVYRSCPLQLLRKRGQLSLPFYVHRRKLISSRSFEYVNYRDNGRNARRCYTPAYFLTFVPGWRRTQSALSAE